MKPTDAEREVTAALRDLIVRASAGFMRSAVETGTAEVDDVWDIIAAALLAALVSLIRTRPTDVSDEEILRTVRTALAVTKDEPTARRH